MKERELLEYRKNRMRLLVERGGRCEVCGALLHLGNLQLAHRIPKTKRNLKVYGKAVMHHDLNLAVVCSLRCNSVVLLSPATHPLEAAELLTKIQRDLERKSK